MEIIVPIVSFILFFGIFFIPILVLRRLNKLNVKYKFIKYITIGVVTTAILSVTFAWWAYESDKLLLVHYGYNRDGWNENENFAQVSPKNIETVKSLERSIGGIGWPLKAIMAFIVYLPCLVIVYLGGSLLKLDNSSIKNTVKKNYT